MSNFIIDSTKNINIGNQSNYVNISNMNVSSATIDTINSTTGNVATINSTTGNIGNVVSTTGTIGTINSTTGNIGTIVSTTGTINTINSTTGTINTINATTGNIGTINSTTGTIETINSTTGNIGNVVSTTGTIGTINSTTGNIGNVVSTTGTIGTINSTTGNITNIYSTTLGLTTYNTHVATTQYVKNALDNLDINPTYINASTVNVSVNANISLINASSINASFVNSSTAYINSLYSTTAPSTTNTSQVATTAYVTNALKDVNPTYINASTVNVSVNANISLLNASTANISRINASTANISLVNASLVNLTTAYINSLYSTTPPSTTNTSQVATTAYVTNALKDVNPTYINASTVNVSVNANISLLNVSTANISLINCSTGIASSFYAINNINSDIINSSRAVIGNISAVVGYISDFTANTFTTTNLRLGTSISTSDGNFSGNLNTSTFDAYDGRIRNNLEVYNNINILNDITARFGRFNSSISSDVARFNIINVGRIINNFGVGDLYTGTAYINNGIFTSSITGPTAPVNTSSNIVATTEFVSIAVSNMALSGGNTGIFTTNISAPSAVFTGQGGLNIVINGGNVSINSLGNISIGNTAINGTRITTGTGFFTTGGSYTSLTGTVITTYTASMNTINASTGNITTLNTSTGNFSRINVSNLDITSLNINTLTANKIDVLNGGYVTSGTAPFTTNSSIIATTEFVQNVIQNNISVSSFAKINSILTNSITSNGSPLTITGSTLNVTTATITTANLSRVNINSSYGVSGQAIITNGANGLIWGNPVAAFNNTANSNLNMENNSIYNVTNISVKNISTNTIDSIDTLNIGTLTQTTLNIGKTGSVLRLVGFLDTDDTYVSPFTEGSVATLDSEGRIIWQAPAPPPEFDTTNITSDLNMNHYNISVKFIGSRTTLDINASTLLSINASTIDNVGNVLNFNGIDEINLNTNNVLINGSSKIVYSSPEITMATNASYNNGMFFYKNVSENNNYINFSTNVVQFQAGRVDINASMIRFLAPTQNFFSNYNFSTGTNVSTAIGFIAPTIPPPVTPSSTEYFNLSALTYNATSSTTLSTITFTSPGIWLVNWTCDVYGNSLPSKVTLTNSFTNTKSAFSYVSSSGPTYTSSGCEICVIKNTFISQLLLACNGTVNVYSGYFKAVRLA